MEQMFLCAKNVLLLELLLFSDQNISIVGVSYYTTCSFHYIVRNLLLIPDTYMLTWKHFVLQCTCAFCLNYIPST